jgi:Ca2+-binding EF-hand superfamily protein
MRTSTPKLLAVALAAALAAPAAFADPPLNAKVNANATTAGAVKTPTTSSASDAVSTRAATREAGRMAAPPNVQAVTGTIKDPPPGKGNWFADADIDGDGKLSVGEANANASVAARFGTIDANADGYVTTEEYRVFYTGTQSQGEVHAQAHSAVVTRDVWMKLDSNDDGKLSSSEVSANSTISGAFSAMDSNGDGFVTQAEYRAYAKTGL